VSDQKIQTYTEFWPFYLREHSNPFNRRLHVIGTTMGGLLLIFSFAGSFYFFIPALLSGYGFAWVGHFFVEKNKPASFKYPGWSFISDFRMLAHFYRGSLNQELEKAGVKK